MEKERNIFEVVRETRKLNEELEEITKLKEEAFEIFEVDRHSLKKIRNIYNNTWKKLESMGYDFGERYTHRLYIHSSNYPDDLDTTISKLERAVINRNEFLEYLEKNHLAGQVLKYIQTIEEDIAQHMKELDRIYNRFAQNTGEFSFIFKSPKIKEIIINKLLLQS